MKQATIASSTMISIMVFMLLLSAVALVQRHAMGSQQPGNVLAHSLGLANPLFKDD